MLGVRLFVSTILYRDLIYVQRLEKIIALSCQSCNKGVKYVKKSYKLVVQCFLQSNTYALCNFEQQYKKSILSTKLI